MKAPLSRWCIALLFPLIGFAAEPAAKLDMRVDKSRIGIGDQIHVTISLEWPSKWIQGTEPDPLPVFEAITEIQPVHRSQAGGIEYRTWRLTLIATTSGAWRLPRPKLTIAGADGPMTLEAPEVIVEVGSGEAEPKLAPARPLWKRPERSEDPQARKRWWIPATAGSLVLMGLAAWLWLTRRRIHRITPHEQFLADLPTVSDNADGKELGAVLARAMRRYCGATWAFDGVGSTAKEVLDRLKPLLATDQNSSLRQFFTRLEELRWTDQVLSSATVKPLLDAARDWVEAIEEERRRLAEEPGAGGSVPPPGGKSAA